MKRKGLLLLIILLGNLTRGLAAADPEADSLRLVLGRQGEDTLKVNVLLDLARHYLSTAPGVSSTYSLQARELAEKLKFRKGEALAFKTLGLSQYMQGNYVETLNYWRQSLLLFEAIGDKTGVSNIQSNIGAVYFNQGDDASALEYYLKSLKAAEELGDKLRIATAEINIGAVYFNKPATHDKALQYYLKALPLSQELDDKDAIGTTAVNLGEIYFQRGKLEEALKYFEISEKAYQNSENLPYALNNIGKVYAQRGDYSKAISYQERAYEFSKKLNARLDMTQSLIALANTYRKKRELNASLSAFQQALTLATELGSAYEKKNAYKGLSLTYADLGQFSTAYKYQVLYTDIKDTLYNIETDKKLSGLLFNYEIEKKQGQIDLLEKDKALQVSNLKRQKVIRNVTISGLGTVMLFLLVVMRQKKKISIEKHRSESLLLNILPEETAEELKIKGKAEARLFENVSVLFTDFKNFTQASEKLSPEDLVEELNLCFSAFDRIVTKYNVEKIKTIGDSYMCASGLPVANPDHAYNIIRAGLEMQDFIEKNIKEKKERGVPYFELRLGIHTGPVVAGIVGLKKFAYDIWGDTVNTASRMESSGEPGKVNISGDTWKLVRERFVFTYRGKVEAKHKGEIDMYFVEGVKSGPGTDGMDPFVLGSEPSA